MPLMSFFLNQFNSSLNKRYKKYLPGPKLLKVYLALIGQTF